MQDEMSLLDEYEIDPQAEKAPGVSEPDPFGIAVSNAAEIGAALSALISTAGWKLVDEFINEQVEAYTSKLIIEKNLDEIRRYQEYIKALTSVQMHPHVTIAEAEKLAAENVSRQASDL